MSIHWLDITYNLWLEGWLHFAILYLLPVDTSEERVAPDVVLAAHSAAQSLAGILREELQRTRLHFGKPTGRNYQTRQSVRTYRFTNFLGLFGQTLRITDIVVRDRGEQFVLVLTVERWLTH